MKKICAQDIRECDWVIMKPNDERLIYNKISSKDMLSNSVKRETMAKVKILSTTVVLLRVHRAKGFIFA